MKIGVWINSAALSNLGRHSFELGSAHEQFGVWTGGPNYLFLAERLTVIEPILT